MQFPWRAFNDPGAAARSKLRRYDAAVCALKAITRKTIFLPLPYLNYLPSVRSLQQLQITALIGFQPKIQRIFTMRSSSATRES